MGGNGRRSAFQGEQTKGWGGGGVWGRPFVVEIEMPTSAQVRQGGQNTSHPFVAYRDLPNLFNFRTGFHRAVCGRKCREKQETSAQSLRKLLAHLRVAFVHLKSDCPNSPKFRNVSSLIRRFGQPQCCHWQWRHLFLQSSAWDVRV